MRFNPFSGGSPAPRLWFVWVIAATFTSNLVGQDFSALPPTLELIHVTDKEFQGIVRQLNLPIEQGVLEELYRQHREEYVAIKGIREKYLKWADGISGAWFGGHAGIIGDQLADESIRFDVVASAELRNLDGKFFASLATRFPQKSCEIRTMRRMHLWNRLITHALIDEAVLPDWHGGFPPGTSADVLTILANSAADISVAPESMKFLESQEDHYLSVLESIDHECAVFRIDMRDQFAKLRKVDGDAESAMPIVVSIVDRAASSFSTIQRLAIANCSIAEHFMKSPDCELELKTELLESLYPILSLKGRAILLSRFDTLLSNAHLAEPDKRAILDLKRDFRLAEAAFIEENIQFIGRLSDLHTYRLVIENSLRRYAKLPGGLDQAEIHPNRHELEARWQHQIDLFNNRADQLELLLRK